MYVYNYNGQMNSNVTIQVTKPEDNIKTQDFLYKKDNFSKC